MKKKLPVEWYDAIIDAIVKEIHQSDNCDIKQIARFALASVELENLIEKFDYYYESIYGEPSTHIDLMSSEGWELISVTSLSTGAQRHYWKRHKIK